MTATGRSVRTLILLMVLAVSGPLLWGCGSKGGGGGEPPTDQPPVQTPSGTVIKGTVPGTIIHAFGDDGSYYRTETNPADPAPRPFFLSVKPGIGYRLVLEEGSVLYPVTFDSGHGGTTNRFYMSLVGTALDLGNVTLSSGRATPEKNPLDYVDTDGDRIVDRADPDFTLLVDDPLDADGDGVPNALEPGHVPAPGDADGDGIADAQDMDMDNDGLQNASDPDADGNGVTESVTDLLARATDQVLALNVQGAYQSFQEIVTREPNHQLGNLGLAITRIGAVLTDFNPGTDTAKIETMKEILDRAGFSQTGRDVSNFTATPPVLSRLVTVDYGYGYTYSYTVSCTVFPDNAPTPNELRAYLNEKLVPQIQAALANLGAITPGFTYTPAVPIMVAGTPITGEVDYSDVLALKAALRSVLTVITLLNAYEIEFDLDDLVNNTTCDSVDPLNYHPIPVQTFFSRYPDLGKLAYPSALSGLKSVATAMMDDAIAALDAVHSEADDQTNDLLTTDPTTYVADRDYLLKLKATFDGPVPFVSATGRSFTWNSAPLFSGINLRSYLPAFMGSQVVYASIRAAGYDPTLGGVLPDFTREDVVRLVDQEPPNVTFAGLSGTVSNPISFEVTVDDVETLPDLTTQIGSGVDPASFRMNWSCYPTTYPNTGCTLTGQDSSGVSITTPSNYADISSFLGVAGPDSNGIYIWTPNGGSVTVNKGGASAVNNYVWVQVQDLAGNIRWYAPASFTVQ